MGALVPPGLSGFVTFTGLDGDARVVWEQPRA